MSSQGDRISIGYFGKIPTRDDFVKAADDALLINIMDEWLTSAMEKLAVDPRWKIIYDEIPPIYFVVAATKMNRAVAGYLVASRDQVERRFPFVSFGELQVQKPETFLPLSPIVLANLWSRLDSQTRLAMESEDSTDALRQLCADDVTIDLTAESYQEPFASFIDGQSVGVLNDQLENNAFGNNARQIILALGLLLHPVMASGVSRLERNLILPLPGDSQHYLMTAAFWMQIVSAFLFKSDFEVAVLLTTINNTEVMVVGFDGASTSTLFSVITPMVKSETNILFADSSWVEDAIKNDYRLQQLSSYLNQPDLQLSTALTHFKETFLG